MKAPGSQRGDPPEGVPLLGVVHSTTSFQERTAPSREIPHHPAGAPSAHTGDSCRSPHPDWSRLDDLPAQVSQTDPRVPVHFASCLALFRGVKCDTASCKWVQGRSFSSRTPSKMRPKAARGGAGGSGRSLPLLLKQREGDRRVAGWLGQPTNVRSCARWMLRLRYCGHLTRRPDSRGKTLMLGGIGGRRRGDDRGRDGWMASATSLSKLVVHGEAWGAAVHGVAKSRTRLSD